MSFSKSILGFLAISGLAIGLTGCGKKDADTGTTATTGTDDTGTVDSSVVFTIEGTAIDFAAQVPAAEGLCVYATDPTAAITGGDLIILSEGTVGAGGAFSLGDVSTESLLGLLILVSDCGGEGTVMPSATGIALADYESLEDGASLTGRSAYVISTEFQVGIDQSVTAAGGSSDIAANGALVGFVFDGGGTPVSGATIDCGGCADIYYGDADIADGLFTSAATGVNGSTDALANGLWVVPGGPVDNYSCDDGTNTYDDLLAGSQPGIAVFVAFYAN